jgi:hypothetical protein
MKKHLTWLHESLVGPFSFQSARYLESELDCYLVQLL